MKTLSEYEQKVLDYLKKNKGLTTFQAVTELHILNVADILMRLRRYGYNIDKVWKTSAKRKRYAVYSLIP